MIDSQGQIRTTAKEMTDILDVGSSRLWSKEGGDWDEAQEWLQRFTRVVPESLRSSSDLHFDRQRSKFRILKHRRTCPGPDGIPIEALAILFAFTGGPIAAICNRLQDAAPMATCSPLGLEGLEDTR